MCLVVTCWERADLLALVCGVLLWVCLFPIGILGQVWYLIVSIPDLCTLTYFANNTAQTNLRIHTVRSVPLLFAYWKLSYVNLLQVKFQFSS